MKRKVFMFFSIGLLMVFMSGCNEAEEILGKVNQILDQQLQSGETEDATNEVSEEMESTEAGVNDEVEEVNEATPTPENTNEDADVEPVENTMNDGHENEADPKLSFEERFQQAGYTKIDPPNGLRIPLPSEWVLVQVIKEDTAWEGVFCFDTQLEDAIASMEESLRTSGFDVISDPITANTHNVHSTKYAYDDGFEAGKGDMVYYVDNYGMACSTVYLEIEY